MIEAVETLTQNGAKVNFSKKELSLFWNNIKKTNHCWLWIGYRTAKGYGQITFRSKKIRAHRLSFWIHRGLLPEWTDYSCDCVLHRCDNPACVNPNHLWLGTQGDNVRDMIRKKRNTPSFHERNGQAKLTKQQVFEIREKYEAGETSYRKLAKEFGVTKTPIERIIRRVHWN